MGASVQHHDDGVRVGLTNMHSTPVRAQSVEQALAGGQSVEAAAELAGDGLEPPADDNGSSEYRKHLATTIVEDALREATA